MTDRNDPPAAESGRSPLKTVVDDGVLRVRHRSRGEAQRAQPCRAGRDRRGVLPPRRRSRSPVRRASRGRATRGFAAGGDLKDLQAVRGAEAAADMARAAKAALMAIRRFPVPVVAALNGAALGGAARNSPWRATCGSRSVTRPPIGFIQGRLAISTAWGGGVDLVRLLGPARALELLCRPRCWRRPGPRRWGSFNLMRRGRARTPRRWLDRFTAPMVRQAAAGHAGVQGPLAHGAQRGARPRKTTSRPSISPARGPIPITTPPSNGSSPGGRHDPVSPNAGQAPDRDPEREAERRTERWGLDRTRRRASRCRPSRLRESGGRGDPPPPGTYPFTRGIFPDGYRGRLWDDPPVFRLRTAPKAPNERYRFLLDHGQTGLSVALDLPTQCGYDPDRPDRPVGDRQGRRLAVQPRRGRDPVRRHRPVRISTSFTINGTAAIVYALYLAVADRKGVPREKADRHDPERHPQGIRRAGHLDLSGAAVDAAGRRQRCSTPTSRRPGSTRSRSPAPMSGMRAPRRPRRWATRWPTGSPMSRSSGGAAATSTGSPGG